MRNIILAVALLFSTSATAHEMTPTYFNITPTIYDNIYVVKMNIFNRRDDASHYQFEAYTEDWVPIVYASFNRQLKLQFGEGASVDLYFREKDVSRLTYICSRSIIDQDSSVSSLICSKVKE